MSDQRNNEMINEFLNDLDRFVERAVEYHTCERQFRKDAGRGRYQYGVSAGDIYRTESKCYEEARAMLGISLGKLLTSEK